VLLTDGESPLQIENWEAIAKKLTSFNFRITIMYVLLTLPGKTLLIFQCGVDFDDAEIDFHEEEKSHIKVTPTQFKQFLLSDLVD
jgi:ATP-dependent DNA helicase 2 subunit 2